MCLWARLEVRLTVLPPLLTLIATFNLRRAVDKNGHGSYAYMKSRSWATWCKSQRVNRRTWLIALFCLLPPSVIFFNSRNFISDKEWTVKRTKISGICLTGRQGRHFAPTNAQQVVKIQQTKPEKPIWTRHETISYDILTCARKMTLVSLISRTEPKTKKWGEK